MKKTIFGSIALASLVLLGAAGCNFQLSQNTKVPLTAPAQNPPAAATSPATPPADTSMSGWHTFTNSQYNFTFQYPKEFKAGTTQPASNQVIDLGDFQNGQEFLSVSLLNSKFDAAQEAAFPGAQKVSLDGQAGYMYPGGGDGPCTSEAVDTSLGDKTLSLSWGACQAAPQTYVMTTDNVNKILKSFKFTK